MYDISNRGTIDNWLRRRDKTHLIPNVIRVTMKTETDRIKELERRNRQLKHALAEERLRTFALESEIEVYEEEIRSKKNVATDSLRKRLNELRQRGSK